MIYIDEIYKKFAKENENLGKIVSKSICTQCPYAVWQMIESGDNARITCLCPKLKIMAYSIGEELITDCTLQKIAISEYQKIV